MVNRLVLTAEEARRLRDGTLTEIRRLFFRLDGDRPVYGPGFPKKPKCCAWEGTTDDDGWPLVLPLGGNADFFRAPAPLGKPGDLLWVAEEWAAHWMYNDVGGSDCRSGHDGDNYWYRADGDDSTGSCGLKASGYRGTWRAADTMPQWASRATVRLTAVRAERTGDTWEWVYSVERSE